MAEPHEGRPDKPAPVQKERRKRSFLDAVISAADSMRWFKLVRTAVARHVPDAYRKPVMAILALCALIGAAFAIANPSHLLAEWYGPNVVIGVADPSTLNVLGKKSLLFEFVFRDDKLAKKVRDDEDVRKLFSGSPFVMLTSECEVELSGREMRVYKLVLIAQNSGHKTAKGYEMMISFSSDDTENPDPGIRILGHGTDALRVGYLYQQEPWARIKAALESCPSLAPFRAEILQEEPDAKSGDEDRPAATKIPALTRDTYKALGLTRDLLILSGTLEAHFFQAATVVIAVPNALRRFATLFHVECANCSWFYKTNSFAQVVGTADIGPAATARGRPNAPEK